MSETPTAGRTAATPLTRRNFLGLAALVGGAAALSACGAGSGSGSSASAATSGSSTLAANTGKITLLTGETYDDQAWLDAYKAKTGVEVTAVNVGSGDEMFAKLQSGAVQADAIYSDSGTIARYVKAGLVTPIDASKVANTSNITPGMDWKTKNSIDATLYGIPYNWGTQPLMYNTSKVTPAPTSWAALWDPQYKGKVVMFDAADVTIPMVALYVGAKDAYNLTDAEFEKVRQALTALRPQVRTIAKGFDDAVNIFASGDGVIGYCQNISEVPALIKQGAPFALAFPTEGTPEWTDNAILTQSGQRQEVYDFINTTLTPEWQSRFITASTNNGVLSSSAAAAAGVPATVIKATNIADQDRPGFWETMSPLMAPESVEKRLEIWNEFKAGA